MNHPGRQQPNTTERSGHVGDDLKAFLDGELSSLRRARIRVHLMRCADCREDLRWLQRLGRNMRHLENAHPRPELRQRILASLPEAAPGRTVEMLPARTPFAFGTTRFALAGACVMLLLVGAYAAPRILSHFGPAKAVATTPQNTMVITQDAVIKKPRTATGNSAIATNKKSGYDPFALNNAKPETPSESDDNAAFNRKVEALFVQRQQERLRQEQRQWNQIVAQRPDLRPLVRTGSKPPVRLAMRIAPEALSSARQALIATTQKLGGTVYAPKAALDSQETSENVSPAPPTGVGTSPYSGSVAHKNGLLLLKVPEAQAKPLLKSLEELGTVNRTTEDASISAIALMSRSPLKPVANADTQTAVNTASVPEATSKQKSTRYLLFVVDLQAQK